MTVARASTTFGRTVLRRAAAQTRSRAWRQAGRRHYASAEHAKKSSDLPWMIGSVVATVPAAVWLIGQAPKKSDHHGPSHAKEEEPAEEEPQEEEQSAEDPKADDSSDDAQTEKTEDSEDESKDATKEESKDKKKDDSKEKSKNEKKGDSKEEGKDEEKDDSKDESKDEKENDNEKDSKEEAKDEAKDDKKDEGKDDKKGSDESKKDKDGYELPGPNAPGQINWKPSLGKGPGEGQKVGTRKPTETKGEKDSASQHSGAQNPYLDDDEKSKKGEGLKDTMKIHGTVDSNRPLSKKEGSKQPA